MTNYKYVDNSAELSVNWEASAVTSRSEKYDTRETDVRRRIFEMTKSRHNISFIYRESLRAMIACLSDIIYIDGDQKSIDIKCIHGNAERTVAKLNQENNIILPMISISQTTSDNDDERRRNDSLLVHEKYWDEDNKRAVRVLSFTPRPVNINYQINVWCKYLMDMDQILEQIRLKFNPEMQIPTSYSTLAKAYIESEEAQPFTAQDKEDRIIQKTINVVLRTYIPSPKFLVTSTGSIEEFKIEVK